MDDLVDGCACNGLASVTEKSALAAGRYLGSDDPEAAVLSASTAAASQFDATSLSGRIIVGPMESEGPLPIGATVGRGGREYELAIDPVQGAEVVARGGYGAISVIAAAEPESMRAVPDVYLRKLAVGPVAAGAARITDPVETIVANIAEAYGRRPSDVTAIVLDRPRHEDLIEEIRDAGARIKLIRDGDIMASISASIRGTNDHLAIGIGGALEGVISAAALQSLGGEVQAQFWPQTRDDIAQIEAAGFADPQAILTTADLVSGETIVAATGISNGDLLRGVRYMEEGARTTTIVLCSACNVVRFVETTHQFTSERRLQVRL